MAASKRTVDQLVGIVGRYVPTINHGLLARELLLVEGSGSVRQTMRALSRELTERLREDGYLPRPSRSRSTQDDGGRS